MNRRLQDILARNVREARTGLGYSQQKLSELAGISVGYVGDIETGKKFPSGEKLTLIADALRLKPYMLLYDGDDLEVRDKRSSLTELSKYLKEVIAAEIDEAVRRYLD